MRQQQDAAGSERDHGDRDDGGEHVLIWVVGGVTVEPHAPCFAYEFIVIVTNDTPRPVVTVFGRENRGVILVIFKIAVFDHHPFADEIGV
jgi:hypothetical protein